MEILFGESGTKICECFDFESSPAIEYWVRKWIGILKNRSLLKYCAMFLNNFTYFILSDYLFIVHMLNRNIVLILSSFSSILVSNAVLYCDMFRKFTLVWSAPVIYDINKYQHRMSNCVNSYSWISYWMLNLKPTEEKPTKSSTKIIALRNTLKYALHSLLQSSTGVDSNPTAIFHSCFALIRLIFSLINKQKARIRITLSVYLLVWTHTGIF